jgi:hypothetical protein
MMNPGWVPAMREIRGDSLPAERPGAHPGIIDR